MTNLAKANSQPDDSRPAPMVCLYGQGAARGYAIGRALVMGAAALEVAHYRVPLASIEAEQLRLRRALETTRSEMLELAQTLPEDAPRELAALLNVHGMLLSDPLLADEALNLIHEKHYNAEWALTTQGQTLGEQFAAMEDEYLRERGADVRQVIERVLHVLSGTRALSAFDRVGETDEPLIVIAHDISPADMIRLRGGSFAGFATDLGGATSHTAIVARSMSVPAVVALGHARSLLRDGDTVILDGVQGALIVNPSPLALAQYKALQEQYLGDRLTLEALKDVPAETLDGITISLEANIELPDEVDLALAHGATGIGLFRSEFLFIGRTELPTEEEQYLAYSSVVKAMQNRPVTIRTLDIGADKALDGEATVATNPALGLRAIRYCLAHPDLFATQLRAILRASAHGVVRILIPMVAHMHEVNAAKAAIESAKKELDARGQSYSDNIQIGCMVEIPATAIAIDPFADALDFLSIGTNDLIQYTLAIDRADNEVSALYDPLHPAVLKLIANTINAGMRAGIPVAVCGEMAGDPKLTRLLLGLGLTNFSMHPQQLLDVKREIRQGHSNALRQQVATALNRQCTIDPSVLE
jgi:phosphotransferase system enzyme I (PtsI)